MRRKIFVGALLALMLLVLTAHCSMAAGPIDDKEAAHLARLNEARQANGLAALKLSTELTAAAKIRAQEITGANSFSHTRPNGTPAYTAIADQTGWNGLSENIAAGKGLDTAYNAVDVLMASAGHRANILKAENVCVGVAAYQDAKGEYFWVELFAQVRPQRDADKTPSGSAAEQTYIQSVNDPTLTVDGAGVHQTTDKTIDYFGGKQRASLAELIRESQKRGRFTLVGTWHTLCGNINDFQVHAEAHKRKAKTSITGTKRTITADSDPTLPRIFELEDLDVILIDPFGGLDGVETMKDAINKYWPSYGASGSVWGNTMCIRTANDQQNTIGKHYGNLVGKADTPGEPALFLYSGGRMVAKSLGLDQSNTFDQWAKKIQALMQAKTPGGSGGDSGEEGESGGEQGAAFTPPASLPELKEAIGTDSRHLIAGANAVTFADGSYSGLTNSTTATPKPAFTRGQRITHTLYMVGEDGELDSSLDGKTLKAEVSLGGVPIITRSIKVSGGRASLELSVSDILAAAPAAERSAAAETPDDYRLRIYSEEPGVGLDLTTRFAISAADGAQSSGGGGGCSAGAAAILSAASLVLMRRRAKKI